MPARTTSRKNSSPLLAHQKELEKKLKAFEQKAAAGLADELAAKGDDAATD